MFVNKTDNYLSQLTGMYTGVYCYVILYTYHNGKVIYYISSFYNTQMKTKQFWNHYEQFITYAIHHSVYNDSVYKDLKHFKTHAKLTFLARPLLTLVWS